jgi:hypothetical protein
VSGLSQFLSDYRRSVVILILGAVLSAAIFTTYTSPRIESLTNAVAEVNDAKMRRDLATDRLATIRGDGLTSASLRYQNAMVLDLLVPQLPSERVKALIMARFNEIAMRSGAVAQLSFATDTISPFKGTVGIEASFQATGTEFEIQAMLLNLASLSPMATVRELRYTNEAVRRQGSSDGPESISISGTLLFIGSSAEALRRLDDAAPDSTGPAPATSPDSPAVETPATNESAAGQ